MNSSITSSRHKIRVEGKEALRDGLEIGDREYEKGLPWIDRK